MNWRNTRYLLAMGPLQKAAYACLDQLNIFEDLKEHDPILVGTVPIDIAVAGSDLDIVCHVKDLEAFADLAASLYGEKEGYTTGYIKEQVPGAFVINFEYMNFEIEIFAQAVETCKQNAYRHMVIEHRLLTLESDKAEILKEKITELKRGGTKTEPAFAMLLGLQGNPYQALFSLEELSDSDLIKLMNRTI